MTTEEMKSKFTETFMLNKWHMGQEETRSGLGSTLFYSKNFSNNLVEIIKKFEIKKIFDCSYGDWNWMRYVSANFEHYIGNDIVEEIVEANKKAYGSEKINFICRDMLSSLKELEYKEFDIVICRHTFEHLPNYYILDVIREISRVSKYALLTSTIPGDSNVNVNTDIYVDGFSYRCINLLDHPFKKFLGNCFFSFIDIDGVNVSTEDVGSRPATYGNLYRFG